ncbi:MAG: SDR family oxidoreductase [Sphingobacteriia bacterium]|nr:SDR family oxidoreductase [Sphingobacteriia bacterium]
MVSPNPLKILVTGGAGFIGSALTETLLQEGHQLTCLDNLSTGKQENIQPFLSHPNYTFISGDIRNFSDCLTATQNQNVILHQAALGSVPRSIKDPFTSHEVNLTGFLNILNAAKENNIKRIVYASSSSVYGDHPALPKIEAQTGKLLSPYAVTKMGNELYAGVFSDLYGLELIGLRYFNVFGRRQDPDSVYAAVIPKFIKSFLSGNSPIIYGDGSNSRDFTYIDNVVQANYLAATTQNPEALNTVYNIAVGDNTTLNQLIEALKNAFIPYFPQIENITPEYGPNRPGDIAHSLASIDKARKLLGYNPLFTLEQGLERYAQWYVQHFPIS